MQELMKSRKIQYLLLAALVLAILYFMVTNSPGTLKKELRNFAVEDTASIDKILLVDKENNSIELERTSINWKLNNNSIARQDLVDALLKTIMQLRVKEPVAKLDQETVMKSLAAKSTKVEIHQKGKCTKVFYVGGATQDSQGTYMILENSSTPFVMEIPGFRGYLTRQFPTTEMVWKAKIVFALPPEEIAEVTVVNNLKKEASFKIRHQNNHVELHSWPEDKNIPFFDTLSVKKYLLEFQKKNFYKYADDSSKEWRDSIKASLPMFTITVQTQQRQTLEIKAFAKPAWGKLDFFGKPLKNDPDLFFLLMNNHDFVYAPYFTFDPLFVDLKSFIKE
jgi:hypothetical protein